MTYEEWLTYGIKNDFCTVPFCETHDLIPMTKAEESEWDQGGDPCVVIVRLGSPEDWLQETDLTDLNTDITINTETKESANGTV